MEALRYISSDLMSINPAKICENANSLLLNHTLIKKNCSFNKYSQLTLSNAQTQFIQVVRFFIFSDIVF